MDDALALVLRAIGAFYLLAAIMGIRAVAMDDLLSQAIDAITPRPPKIRLADRFRNRFLLTSTLLIGLAAIALIGLAGIAAPLLCAATGAQIVYLTVLAPHVVDPAEAPDEQARRRSWLATGMMAAASLLVVAASHRGHLRPTLSEPMLLAALGTGFVALGAFALWTLKPWRNPLSATGPAAGWTAEPDLSDALPTLHEGPRPDAHGGDGRSGLSPAELGAATAPALNHATIRLVVTPSWHAGAVVDAETRMPLDEATRSALLTEMEDMLLQDWLCLWRDVGDPADPWRCGFAAADGALRMAELGQPIVAGLRERLGPDRVIFEPTPRPIGPAIATSAVVLVADYGCDPLWFAGSEAVGCFSPHEFGLSWALALDLGVWSLDYDDSIDLDDPAGPPRWSPADEAAHVESGRALAGRLVAELAATGRSDVSVVYRPSHAPKPMGS